MSLNSRELYVRLGWDDFFEKQYVMLNEDLIPARVAGEERGCFRLQTPHANYLGEISGRFRFDAVDRSELPATGDWVACRPQMGIDRAVIHHVFRRRSCLMRKSAGTTHGPQLLAANVDTAFLMTSANADLNPRRLERYLTLVWDGGATPVILLTKSDLAEGLEASIAALSAVAPGVEVLAVSTVTGSGMAELGRFLAPTKTVVMLGSSGVGKSTLVNFLVGREALATQSVREKDDRGRHTTTSRYLFELPGGGMLIDTPGMRELGLMDHEEGLKTQFEDIEKLSLECRFTDCQHRTEPGCRIKEALRTGELDPERMNSYEKLEKELRFERRKIDKAYASRVRNEWKKVTKALRAQKK